MNFWRNVVLGLVLIGLFACIVVLGKKNDKLSARLDIVAQQVATKADAAKVSFMENSYTHMEYFRGLEKKVNELRSDLDIMKEVVKQLDAHYATDEKLSVFAIQQVLGSLDDLQAEISRIKELLPVDSSLETLETEELPVPVYEESPMVPITVHGVFGTAVGGKS